VADLPFLSYQVSEEIALTNAARLLQEGGAQAVKLEGGVSVAPTVKRLTDAGIAVMGHIGFTPQSVHQLGGYRVQGRTEDAAARLLEDALALQDAGAFAVVLELVPTEVAATITERLDVPTIGIGAGPDCDGQVQVFHDLLGLLPDFRPKHAGRYGDLAGVIDEALSRYADDVRGNKFPTDAESFSTKSSNSGSGGK
jgi:3-methyl-2-oxobutanoate hydroxymethyltransferase